MMKLAIKKNMLRKSVLITLSILLVLCLVEFIFDIAEITLGVIVETTNSFRPKTGTIWELAQRDQLANENLLEITQNISETDKPPDINDIFTLKTVLEEQETVLISADQFLDIYNTLPPRSAQTIISPLELLKIFYSNQWVWTKITKGESSLHFYFLNGENQLLMDSYPDLSIFYRVAIDEWTTSQTLESMDVFSGRLLTPEQFFDTFNRLPNAIKLQLINNPFKLIKWREDIRAVAISNVVENNTVLIGFEVQKRVHTFQASELAISYFISQLNDLYPELKLTMPGN